MIKCKSLTAKSPLTCQPFFLLGNFENWAYCSKIHHFDAPYVYSQFHRYWNIVKYIVILAVYCIIIMMSNVYEIKLRVFISKLGEQCKNSPSSASGRQGHHHMLSFFLAYALPGLYCGLLLVGLI